MLGLLFVMASVMFFLKLGPQPQFSEGSPIAHYMAAFGPDGLLRFVKGFERRGGILVVLPRTRHLGLLVLGPIIVNIIAFVIRDVPGLDAALEWAARNRSGADAHVEVRPLTGLYCAVRGE